MEDLIYRYETIRQNYSNFINKEHDVQELLSQYIVNGRTLYESSQKNGPDIVLPSNLNSFND